MNIPLCGTICIKKDLLQILQMQICKCMKSGKAFCVCLEFKPWFWKQHSKELWYQLEVCFAFPYIKEWYKDIEFVSHCSFYKKGDDIKVCYQYSLGHMIMAGEEFLPDIHQSLTFPSFDQLWRDFLVHHNGQYHLGFHLKSNRFIAHA